MSLITSCSVKNELAFAYPKWLMMCKDMQPIYLSNEGINALPRGDKEKIASYNEINDYYCMWD